MAQDEMRRRGLLVILSGPAGSGKTTLARHAITRDPDICRSVTATTRPPRPNEVEGRDYFFLSRNDFERRREAGGFLEHAEFNGNLYGTPRAELEARLAEDKVVLLVIDVQGAAQVRTRMLHALHVFVLPPSREVLRQRLAVRGTETAAEVTARLAIAEQEVLALNRYDYLVINDSQEAATDDLLAIIATARTHHIRGGEREAWSRGAFAGWHQSSGRGPGASA